MSVWEWLRLVTSLVSGAVLCAIVTMAMKPNVPTPIICITFGVLFLYGFLAVWRKAE